MEVDAAPASSEECPLSPAHCARPSIGANIPPLDEAAPACGSSDDGRAGGGSVVCSVNDNDGPDLPADMVLNLEQLIAAVKAQLSWKKGEIPLQCRLKIKELMRRFDHTSGELSRYAFHDPHKYTRNLVATDNETFTLLLLVWPKGKSSCIHDHPCSNGCYVKLVDGGIIEHRYRLNAEENKLELTAINEASKGAVTYIDDSMGLHSVGNTSKEDIAISLHLYSPPFKSCKVWLDAKSPADKPVKAVVTFHSEYGVLNDYSQPCSASSSSAGSVNISTVGTVVGTGGGK